MVENPWDRYAEMEDHQLIHQIASLDKNALEALYDRYLTSVYSLAMYMLRHDALAEEVTQEIFLNIWLKAGSFNATRGAPRSWIMSVAHHKIVDLIRSRRRGLTMTDPAEYETLDLLSFAVFRRYRFSAVTGFLWYRPPPRALARSGRSRRRR